MHEPAAVEQVDRKVEVEISGALAVAPGSSLLSPQPASSSRASRAANIADMRAAFMRLAAENFTGTVYYLPERVPH